jgi:four helix bundle protein
VFLNYLDIALGSQGVVEVQIELAKRLRFCGAADHGRIQERVERIGRMLNSLMESIELAILADADDSRVDDEA